MEQVEDLRTGKVKHRATVQKDRSTLLDGEQIDNPDFKDFLPHIERLNLGGDHLGVDINGDSQHILRTEKRDWQPVQRKIALGEIEEILVRHYPGQAAADKKAKARIVKSAFGACWAEIESIMPLERLRSGYDTLHHALENEWSKYHQAPAPAINDELPDHSAPPKALDTSERDGLPVSSTGGPNGSADDAAEATFVDLVGAR